MYDLTLSSLANILELGRVENLVLDNIESGCLENLFDRLLSLSRLSSLVIISDGNVRNKNNIYRQIFGLPALKYCKLSLPGRRTSESLPISVDEYSPIEHLIIVHSIDLRELDGLLSYVPQLRRLSLYLSSATLETQTERCQVVSNHLTHIALRVNYLRFNVFEQIFKEFIFMIEVLHLTFTDEMDPDYINANKWEQLITSHIPHLRIFDIQCKYVSSNLDCPLGIVDQINQFTSSFWMTRQWFFSHHFYYHGFARHTLLYSTNPYRY